MSHLPITLITLPCLIGLWMWGEVWVRFLGGRVSGGLMMDEDVEVYITQPELRKIQFV